MSTIQPNFWRFMFCIGLPLLVVPLLIHYNVIQSYSNSNHQAQIQPCAK